MVGGHVFNRINMHKILGFMARRAKEAGRSFVVHRDGLILG